MSALDFRTPLQKYEDGDLDYYTILSEYQKLKKELNAVTQKEKNMKEAIIFATRKEGGGDNKVITGNLQINVSDRRSLKAKRGALNWLKNSGYEDCIEVKKQPCNKKIWKKIEDGDMDMELFNEFFDAGSFSVLTIKNLK